MSSLNLSQNERITNRGAAALASLSNLRALNLSNTKVTSAALTFLSALSKLQSLALYGCQGINDNSRISVLQNELPSLKCLRLHGMGETDSINSDVYDSEHSWDEDDSLEIQMPPQLDSSNVCELLRNS